MILVDTSIWVDHLRHGGTGLSALLKRCEVLTHPLVIGELACGHLRHRPTVLKLLGSLPQASIATDAETLYFIEHRGLMGRGIGYVDAQLLAAVALTPHARIWTRDKSLTNVAFELGLGSSGPETR